MLPALFFLLVMGFAAAAQAPLDGRSYAIQLYENELPAERDTLSFRNGQLHFATARKYGFAPATYQFRSKANRITGSALHRSKLNGTMLWNFTVVADSIYGLADFDNRVENPIRYRFSGKELHAR
ncbi:MAG: hypothetical protein RMK52_07775 [Chitinophagales bacterium]|nr:hypothetical protein [Chitinophagales bacterium]MDW8394127.1 hypothetical protein [Chitinophagales bacterium]